MGKELQDLCSFEYNHLSNPPAIEKNTFLEEQNPALPLFPKGNGQKNDISPGIRGWIRGKPGFS
jgi:hypothetical protein